MTAHVLIFLGVSPRSLVFHHVTSGDEASREVRTDRCAPCASILRLRPFALRVPRPGRIRLRTRSRIRKRAICTMLCIYWPRGCGVYPRFRKRLLMFFFKDVGEGLDQWWEGAFVHQWTWRAFRWKWLKSFGGKRGGEVVLNARDRKQRLEGLTRCLYLYLYLQHLTSNTSAFCRGSTEI